MFDFSNATSIEEKPMFQSALNELGNALRSIRVSSGFSQEKLATEISKLTGSRIEQSSLSRIEKNQNRFLDWNELYAACRVLNCSPDHVFEHALRIARNNHAVESGATCKETLLEEIAEGKESVVLTRDEFNRPAEQIHSYLRRRIILGEYPNGEIVQASAVAEEFDVEPEEVVLAFNLLKEEGFVTYFSNESWMVPEYSIHHMISVVCRRLELEATAAVEIAKSDDVESILDKLYQLHVKMSSLESKLRVERSEANYAVLKGEFTEADFQFHLLLLRHSKIKNKTGELARLVIQVLVGTQTMSVRLRPEEVLDEHAAIIEAIRKKDDELIINSLRDHMIGNARQWESILNDRLDRTRRKEDVAKRRQTRRFETFQNDVAKKCKDFLRNLHG